MIETPASPPTGVITVRPAKAEDVPLIFENIGYWASQGKMLVRPMQNIFENLRDFFVAEIETDKGKEFAGNGALHILWGDIAEVRGLAVRPDIMTKGVGKKLVEACESEARRIGIPTLFAWTYSVGFFEKCGFKLIDKSKDLHPRVSGQSVCAAPFLWVAMKTAWQKGSRAFPFRTTCQSRHPRKYHREFAEKAEVSSQKSVVGIKDFLLASDY
jgi:amino-acid N-acetyltransferase